MKLQQLRFFRPPVSTTASLGPPGSSISPSHPQIMLSTEEGGTKLMLQKLT